MRRKEELEALREMEERKAEEEKLRHRELIEVSERSADKRHRELLEVGGKARLDAIERYNTKEMRIKRCSDLIQGCLYKMPDDPLEIPAFFVNAERHFNTYQVGEELRLALINPFCLRKLGDW